MNALRILGIDTTGRLASVALYDTEQMLFLGQSAIDNRRGHARLLVPHMERLLEDCHLTLEDVDMFAAADGPGSYTGIRIGISTIQAIAYVRQKPVAGVSSLESLAWLNQAWQGRICAVMRARAGVVYAGWYEADAQGIQCIQADAVLTDTELMQQCAQTSEKVLFCGDAADVFAGDNPVAPPYGRLPQAVGVCMGAAAGVSAAARELKPRYLQKVKIG